ncbi:hypothetical protein K438DRAFT_1783811 [Mycena galopus ATCC 62051]|nr:hypothetical protein K438DRAFT_1783811 [Mycena galopus ATCC 62051]
MHSHEMNQLRKSPIVIETPKLPGINDATEEVQNRLKRERQPARHKTRSVRRTYMLPINMYTLPKTLILQGRKPNIHADTRANELVTLSAWKDSAEVLQVIQHGALRRTAQRVLSSTSDKGAIPDFMHIVPFLPILLASPKVIAKVEHDCKVIFWFKRRA